MAIQDVIKLLARFGQFYWSPDGVRDKAEFAELADGEWRDALIYFVREFAYERQGASRDYVVAAALAISKHAGDAPTNDLADRVWAEASTLLKAGADGKGTNRKRQPIAPTEGHAIGLIDFVAGLTDADHNIVRWARDKCANGDAVDAHAKLTQIRGVGGKIAALFLRDVISGFGVDEAGIPAYCFQPIDVWTGRAAEAIAPGLDLPVPAVPSSAAADVLVQAAQRADVKAADLNAGAWVFGAQILGSNIEFGQALASEAAFWAALERAAERVQREARRAGRRVDFLAEVAAGRLK